MHPQADTTSGETTKGVKNAQKGAKKLSELVVLMYVFFGDNAPPPNPVKMRHVRVATCGNMRSKGYIKC